MVMPTYPSTLYLIAGNPGSVGELDGVGTGAHFNGPFGICADLHTNPHSLLVCDGLGNAIRRVYPQLSQGTGNGNVITVASNYSPIINGNLRGGTNNVQAGPLGIQVGPVSGDYYIIEGDVQSNGSYNDAGGSGAFIAVRLTKLSRSTGVKTILTNFTSNATIFGISNDETRFFVCAGGLNFPDSIVDYNIVNPLTFNFFQAASEFAVCGQVSVGDDGMVYTIMAANFPTVGDAVQYNPATEAVTADLATQNGGSTNNIPGLGRGCPVVHKNILYFAGDFFEEGGTTVYAISPPTYSNFMQNAQFTGLANTSGTVIKTSIPDSIAGLCVLDEWLYATVFYVNRGESVQPYEEYLLGNDLPPVIHSGVYVVGPIPLVLPPPRSAAVSRLHRIQAV
jgi:hypothetical protein